MAKFSSLVKLLIALALLVSLSNSVSSQVTYGDGDEICDDITQYDEVFIDGEVDVCPEGVNIEAEYIEVTDSGYLDGSGEEGDDHDDEGPGGNGENGYNIDFVAEEVNIYGTVSSDGGDGGDGGDAGGNRDGGDGGEGGDAGNINIVADFELNIFGEVMAEGGRGGSGGSGGPAGGSSGIGGDGGDGGIIELTTSSFEDSGDLSVSGGSGGSGSQMGESGEDGEVIEQVADITMSSFDSPNEVEKYTSLEVEVTLQNDGSYEGSEEIFYYFNDHEVDSDTVTIGPDEEETVTLVYDEVDEERGEYEHRVETSSEQLERPIIVEYMYFEVSDIITNSPVEEGELEVEAVIENTGDIYGEQEIDFYFNHSLEETIPEDRAGIDAGETESFFFTKEVDDLDGDYRVNISTDDDMDSTSVVIGDAPYFEVEIMNTSETDPGDILSVNASVENIGGLLEEQSIDFFFEGSLEGSQSLELEGGEQEYIEFNYTTSEEDGGYRDVTVESEDESDTETVLIGDEAYYHVDITGISPPDIDPGDVITVEVDVENLGDAEAEKDVYFFYDGNIEDVEEDVILDGGDQQTFNFDYDTTGDPEDVYDITVETEDSYDSVSVQVGTYDIPAGDDDGTISYLELEEISNEIEPEDEDSIYIDYTEGVIGEKAVLARGETYDITITTDDAPGWGDHHLTLFFDWDQNIDFNDPIYLEDCAGTCDVTSSFLVDEDAELGDTRMRAFVDASSYIDDPYLEDLEGQAQDFSVEIVDSEFIITEMETMDEVVKGEYAYASATITNTGEAPASDTVRYYFDGEQIDTETISLGPGDSITTSFSYNTSDVEVGNYIEEITTSDDSESQLIDVINPDIFEVSIIGDNGPLNVSETLEVDFEVFNTGDVEGEQELELLFDGEVVNSTLIQLEPEESVTETLKHTVPDEKDRYEYIIRSDDESDSGYIRVGDYSRPEADPSYEYMSYFEIEEIQNTNENDEDGYIDFTEEVATVERGNTYNVVMESEEGFYGDEHYFNVFGDWEGNMEFEESQNIGSCTTEGDGCQVTGTLTIPEDAELGETRLRSILRYDQYHDDPDEGGFFGQVHDYTIDIQDDNFEVIDFDSPSEILEGETIEPEITVENTGQLSGTAEITYMFDGGTVSEETETLDPGDTYTMTPEYTVEEEGGYYYTHTAETQDDSYERDIFVGNMDFLVDITSTNSPVANYLEIEAEIENVGTMDGEQDIEFYFDNDLDDVEEDFLVQEDETRTLEFTKDVSTEDDGTYEVNVSSDDDYDTANIVKGQEPFFEVDITGDNSPIDEEGTLEIDFDVENVGDIEDEQDILLIFNNEEVERIENIYLESGDVYSDTFFYDTTEEPGEYEAVVESEDSSDSTDVLIGELGYFEVDIIDSNNPDPGEMLEVTAEINNTGDLEGTQLTEMEFDNNIVDEEEITLDGGAVTTHTYNFDTEEYDEGIYDVYIHTDDESSHTKVQIGGYEIAVGDTEYEHITYFELTDISHSSGDDGGYADFTYDEIGQKAFVMPGGSYDVTMESQSEFSGDDHYFNVFGDWNQNIEFDQGSHDIGSCETGSDGCQVTGTLTIPEDAELGETRLRAFLMFDEYQTDPYNDDFYGEAEDYTVEVVEPYFEIINFEAPDTAVQDGTIYPNTTVENTGGVTGEQQIIYKVEGDTKDLVTLELEPGGSETVEFEYTVEEEPGEYEQKAETEDDYESRNLEVIEPPTVELNNLYFEDRIVENQDTSIIAETTNTGDLTAENIEINLSIDEYGEEWEFLSYSTESVTLDSGETKNVSFTEKLVQGPNRVTAEPGSDEEEALTELVDVSSYNIFYGGSEKTVRLGADDSEFNTWLRQEPEGNILFADIDSDISFSQLEAPTETGFLETIDDALGITNHNDSVEDLWDEEGDGTPDKTDCFIISDDEVCEVPVVNSTITEDFQTGILYDTSQGEPYDGSQDLVFITEVNPNTEGEHGIYDYEAKVPANIRTLSGETESVEIFTDLN